MGKSWKDKNRRDKWDRFSKPNGGKKPKKNWQPGKSPNKWTEYDESESY